MSTEHESADAIRDALAAIEKLKEMGLYTPPSGSIPSPTAKKEPVVEPEGAAEPITVAPSAPAPPKPKKVTEAEITDQIITRIKNTNPIPAGLESLIPNKAAFYRPNNTILHRIAMSMKRGRNILLVGDAGTGKSSLVEYICAQTDTPLIRINLNGQTSSSELIGHYIVKEGATHWVEGVLPLCMRNGIALLLDEVDCADPGVLALLHPVLEPNGKLMLKEHDNDIISPAPGFRIFATANSLGIHDDSGLYTGTNPMNHAFLSRWIGVAVDYPDVKEEAKIFLGHGINKDVAEKVAKASAAIRKMIREDRSVVGVWGTRHAIDFGQFTMDSGSFNAGFQTAAGLKFSKAETTALWETVQRITGDKVVIPEEDLFMMLPGEGEPA